MMLLYGGSKCAVVIGSNRVTPIY